MSLNTFALCPDTVMNRISLKGLITFPDSDLSIQPGVCHLLQSTSLKCLHKSLGRMLVAAEMHVMH